MSRRFLAGIASTKIATNSRHDFNKRQMSNTNMKVEGIQLESDVCHEYKSQIIEGCDLSLYIYFCDVSLRPGSTIRQCPMAVMNHMIFYGEGPSLMSRHDQAHLDV